MSFVFKNFDFQGYCTVQNLKAPVNAGDGVRYTDLTTATTSLQSYADSAVGTESTARTNAVNAITTAYETADSTITSGYQSADAALNAALQAQMQSLVSGFTNHDPAYAILVAPVPLTAGLAFDQVSFSGNIPEGSRVLVAGQGGDLVTADPANGVYIASGTGAWTRATDLSTDSEIVRSALVPVTYGTGSYADTIYFIAQPEVNAVSTIGTTPVKFQRWQGNDRVLVDGTTIVRNGNTLSALLNGTYLQAGSNGIELTPSIIATFHDLAQATGSLPTDQISGLTAFVQAITLNQLTAPTAAVSFNGQVISNVAAPSQSTDAVNLTTMQAALTSLQNTMQSALSSLQSTIQSKDVSTVLNGGSVVGSDTVFTVTHNLGSLMVMEKVFNQVTGESVDSDFVRVTNDLNSCQVAFRNQSSIAADTYVLLLHKVA